MQALVLRDGSFFILLTIRESWNKEVGKYRRPRKTVKGMTNEEERNVRKKL